MLIEDKSRYMFQGRAHCLQQHTCKNRQVIRLIKLPLAKRSFTFLNKSNWKCCSNWFMGLI